MKFIVMIACLMLAGCAGFRDSMMALVPPEPECDPVYAVCKPPAEIITIEMPQDELLKTCGLWSGSGGCIWMNHKFVLKPEGVAL